MAKLMIQREIRLCWFVGGVAMVVSLIAMLIGLFAIVVGSAAMVFGSGSLTEESFWSVTLLPVGVSLLAGGFWGIVSGVGVRAAAGIWSALAGVPLPRKAAYSDALITPPTTKGRAVVFCPGCNEPCVPGSGRCPACGRELAPD